MKHVELPSSLRRALHFPLTTANQPEHVLEITSPRIKRTRRVDVKRWRKLKPGFGLYIDGKIPHPIIEREFLFLRLS